MQYAQQKNHSSALSAFEAVGRAYLAFARKFPGYYIAMFESGINLNRDPEISGVATGAMNGLISATEALCQHIPADKRPPASMIANHIWAMSHGVVELFARGEPGTNTPYSAEDLLESGIGIYLRGLGVIPQDR
jgi:hypothetical protein